MLISITYGWVFSELTHNTVRFVKRDLQIVARVY